MFLLNVILPIHKKNIQYQDGEKHSHDEFCIFVQKHRYLLPIRERFYE